MRTPIRRVLVKGILVVLTGMALSSCETVQTTQGGVVGVDRKQMMAVSSEQIDQASSQTYAKLIAQERAKGTLDRDAAQVGRVRAIANRLIAQTPAFRPEARNWQWEVNVITSSEVNAWCMPGGKIAVYTGLIEKLRATDDELAAVIGHEIAHALREHARERASEQAVAGAGISILAAVAGLGDIGQKGMEYAYMGLLGLPNSRRHETESDRIGVELAARAGYDPRAAITLWQKMGQASGGEPIKFLSTHPSREDRIADLTVYAQRVLPLYEQSRKK
ncbi:M48 family metallopeptidase [Janthinobacterium sp. 17J80-10]|uniref:M48 family metallopeptidase n=1 Tax=Janthinobacterium sp. 17J80-10 TaxID=2497863 RepID=UPI0010056185|nr:M48 family metallopeptidase [Janthinobacterium sp. 17J80-10]QAU34741.1 M48 family peptidase [Janthinobacterium sp. 17J80-10]